MQMLLTAMLVDALREVGASTPEAPGLLWLPRDVHGKRSVDDALDARSLGVEVSKLVGLGGCGMALDVSRFAPGSLAARWTGRKVGSKPPPCHFFSFGDLSEANASSQVPRAFIKAIDPVARSIRFSNAGDFLHRDIVPSLTLTARARSAPLILGSCATKNAACSCASNLRGPPCL